MADKKTKQSAEHDDAAHVLTEALLHPGNAKKKQAAQKHATVKPILKKLGPQGFETLSAIAKNQSNTCCDCY